MYKLKIKVTKDILKKSMMCGTDSKPRGSNCAIALAVREIFPLAGVGLTSIYPHFFVEKELGSHRDAISLPRQAEDFIVIFDSVGPEMRPLLPELEFEVSLPQCVIDAVNISELEKTLKTSETLELVRHGE